MKTIIELLKNPKAVVRVCLGDTWLVWDEAEEQWHVYQWLVGARRATEIILTPDEGAAVQAFERAARMVEEQT